MKITGMAYYLKNLSYIIGLSDLQRRYVKF